MQPIRVLHVFGSLDCGGAESRTLDIYRQIDKDKVQFDFLIHTYKKGIFEEEIKKMGGQVYRVPRLGIRTFFLYQKEIDDFFKKHSEYKIIHGHILSTAFIYQKVAKKYGCPVRIAHSRCGDRSQINIENIIKELCERFSRFYVNYRFAVSKLAGYSAFGKKNVDSGRVVIIPNAIKADKYTFDENIRQEIRKELGVENSLVVGHIGRFSPQKNHKFIIDIFSEAKKEHDNSKLLLIGDGPLINDIRKKVSEFGLENDVLFLGVRSDVPNLLNAMDVLLFPSTHEGLPGVVLEAQASGLPCFISDKITTEVRISNLVEYISINNDSRYWAEKIIYASKYHTRINTYKTIVEAGYDIGSVAKWYEMFYLEKAQK